MVRNLLNVLEEIPKPLNWVAARFKPQAFPVTHFSDNVDAFLLQTQHGHTLSLC